MELKDILKRRELRQNINDDFTKIFIEKFKLKENANCLEIGAGLGSIAYFLADLCKNGNVDVIDIKEENVKEILKHKRNNMNVKQIAIQDSFFNNRKYDFIHARFVFEHIDKPKDVVSNIIKNNLRNNGILFLEDAVYENVNLLGDPIYKKVMEAYINVIKSDGSNYYWGMEMNKCFIDNGLKDVNSLGIVRVLNGGSEETKFWKASIIENYQKIKSQGILSDEIDETIKNLSDINKWFSGPIIMGTYGKKLI